MLELDALLAVHRLLLLERAVVEQLLQALVRVVDAQLLEAVLLEDLEPEDVQKPDEFVPLSVQVLVDLLHLRSHPLPTPTIQSNSFAYSSFASASQFWSASYASSFSSSHTRQLNGMTVTVSPEPSRTLMRRVQIASSKAPAETPSSCEASANTSGFWI